MKFQSKYKTFHSRKSICALHQRSVTQNMLIAEYENDIIFRINIAEFIKLFHNGDMIL